MPHVVLEYSQNVEPLVESSRVLQALHAATQSSGLFDPNDVKTRAYPAEAFMVGEMGAQGSFAHAYIYLLEGRTAEQKIALAQRLKATLDAHLDAVNQRTVDIRDMGRATYCK
jgi:5-carboxymethyl-2-hydroxymuconate isomerase